MFELLLHKIKEKIQLTAEEEQLLSSFFVPKKLRKKQYLLQEGDICKHVAFVNSGILRSFTVNEKGNEYIMQFAFEGWWISDQFSFISGEPSLVYIEALEPTEILLLSKDSREEMFNRLPKIERFFRILLENHLVSLQRRLMHSISYPAEIRYKQLLEIRPDIAQKVPQHMIASYLGITPETLSRIRKQIATR